ncbi:unnamed protein product [Phytophthora lilii]|uniref:Unnamed protein product n=1 Tax=Phytophthora lilii TaxID=2077276 RepID=A0A9W6WZW6_9STRA|nr:unnamed protein product [Phytophthora lilii]
MWSEFDSSTVVQLTIRHCPALEVPDIFAEFHELRGIKVYNTTINGWSASAAITGTNHPSIMTLFIVRVNMTHGVLPEGFQSAEFPVGLYNIKLCITNVREMPDDLETKWRARIILIEYSQLTVVPLVLARTNPLYLVLTGNPITDLPSEVFEAPGMTTLGLSDTNIQELPQNVTQLSATLGSICIENTGVSFFWAWADKLAEQASYPVWHAGGSVYCDDLSRIQNGTSNAFQVPLSHEYSSVLMDPSIAGRQTLLNAITCNASTRLLFYSLAITDNFNAISTPPPVSRLR